MRPRAWRGTFGEHQHAHSVRSNLTFLWICRPQSFVRRARTTPSGCTAPCEHPGSERMRNVATLADARTVVPPASRRVDRIRRYHPATNWVGVDYTSNPPARPQRSRRGHCQWLRVRPCRRPGVVNSYRACSSLLPHLQELARTATTLHARAQSF